jgi:hypothetical protein
MYALSAIGQTAGAVDAKQIKAEVAAFYDTFLRTRALTEKILSAYESRSLTQNLFDRHRQLLFNFRTLYAELYDALTPTQQSEVFKYFEAVTPAMGDVKRGQLLGDLGIAPLIVVLIVAGTAVTIGVSKVVADALVAYKAELARQEKEAAFIRDVQADVREGVLTAEQGVDVIKARPEGAIPPAVITNGPSIFETLSRNLVYIAVAGAAFFVLNMFSKR